MKHNPIEVAQLQPDYLGFIFWEPSTRYFDGDMPDLPKSIKKIGVFVDATIEDVLQKVEKYNLDGVQLHGKESPEFCRDLKENFLSFRAQSRKRKVDDSIEVSTALDLTGLEVIKVFSIKDEFDFSVLKLYEASCDYFLFDTKGKLPGGNGYTFDWSVLNNYPSTKPFFLSGGIGLETASELQAFLKSPASKKCHAIDVNSRFEIQPGLKNSEELKEFKRLLTSNFEPNTDN